MKYLLTLCLSIASIYGFGQIPTNYDESKIPDYELPKPLVTASGKKIETPKVWEKERRAQILDLFKENVYGKIPGNIKSSHRLINKTEIFGGKGILKQVELTLGEGDQKKNVAILMILPKSTSPVPVFLGLNFCGNHCTTPDPNVLLAESWINDRYPGVENNSPSDASRGSSASRYPYEEIVSRGYGMVTVYNGDFEPDHAEGWKNGVRGIFQKELNIKPEEWSAMGAWAWGLSRVQDYLEKDKDVDASQTIVYGHSRLGKAALWAGANDLRFAGVISNNSGEGGAALSKRWYGETIEHLNNSFPHWFIDKYDSYNGKAENLPVDQHMLLSLIAPRPLYVASAEEDQWADPKGEFLSLLNAEPVYSLYKKEGLGTTEMPKVNQPIGKHIRYHIRTGKHDVTLYDWQQYLNFADDVLGKNKKRS